MMKKEYSIYILILIALLPLLINRDFTPSNELRYLSIADEAIRNGQFFAFTNHGIPYADKPPLYLWIVMLGKVLFGSHQMWFLSLFSLLPAFGCTMLMNRWVKEELNPSMKTMATVLLLSCGMFPGTAIVLRMDMLMCLFILLALHSFYRMVKDETYLRSNRSLLFPLYMFLALFTKGPLGVLIPLVSAYVFLAVTGRLRRAGHFTGGWKTWAVLLAGCACWFGLVYVDGGSAYLHNLLFHQTVDRAVNAFHHKRAFYYYFYSVWYAMLPWSLLTIGTIIAAACKRLIKTDLEKLFLTVIVSTFIMLSMISSKLDVYLIPAYPFMIYLSLIYLQRFRFNGWQCVAVAIPALAFTAAAPGLYFLSNAPRTTFLGQTCFYISAGILTSTGLISLYLLFFRHSIRLSTQMMVIGMFAALFTGGFGVPSINNHIGYAELCQRSLEEAHSRHIKTFCVWKMYRPENMDVYLHRDVHILPDNQPLPENLHNVMLMTPSKEANNVPHKKAQWIIGANTLIVL